MITHCNLVIAFLDDLEELRPLFNIERSFRFIIQNHLQRLLHCQQVHWRKRYIEKLVKWGDENTKFFHARATKRYRFNIIKQVIDSDGREVTDHHEKAALFFQEFRNRLGFTANAQMLFDLSQLMDQQDLWDLVQHFIVEEMDAVAAQLPIDKAPRPDGFDTSSKNVGL